MLDLKYRGLPNAIAACGQVFLLNTDFRPWLQYPGIIREDLRELFTDRTPPLLTREVIEQLDCFYMPPAELPRGSSAGVPLVDWDLDADLIYAAFMQAYSIDLIETGMHWHKFLALFSALPEETLMVKIMSYRAYAGQDKDMLELRDKWALPERLNEEEQQAVDEFNELLG